MSASPVLSPDPGPGFDPGELVARETAAVAVRRLGPSLRGIVLTGSLARGEGTFVRQGARWRALGDAEFFLVLEDGAAWLDPKALEAEAEDALLAQGVACRPELTPTHAGYLRSLPPSIFAHELKACGRVVAGDAHVLSLVPAFGPQDVPLEDGWRLLANRMVEMLEWPTPLPREGDPLPESVAYRTIKLGLDVATSLLVFLGQFVPGYRARADRLQALAGAAAGGAPVPLSEVAPFVADLTRRKLEGRRLHLDWEDWRRVMGWTSDLWSFEVARLLGEPAPARPPAMVRLGHRQPLAEKARGWLHLWRAHGWMRGGRHLPAILRRLHGGSPRYHVYAVASELFQELPRLLPSRDATVPADARWQRLRASLPLPSQPPSGSARPVWQELAVDVLGHYRRYLVKTRS